MFVLSVRTIHKRAKQKCEIFKFISEERKPNLGLKKMEQTVLRDRLDNVLQQLIVGNNIQQVKRKEIIQIEGSCE